MWRKIILLSKTELFDGYSIAFNKPFFTYYIIQFSKEGFHWLRFTELVNGLKETPITWTNQPIKLKEKVKLNFSRSPLVTCFPRSTLVTRFPRSTLVTCFPTFTANYMFSSGHRQLHIFPCLSAVIYFLAPKRLVCLEFSRQDVEIG